MILGGDETVIPYRYVRSDIEGAGINVASDYYYTCLDGNWNSDYDQYYGEIGDSVDLAPDVALGRVPVSTPTQVNQFISKLNSYVSGDSVGWQNKAMFLGSEMFSYRDGKAMSQDLAGLLDGQMTVSEMYDDTGGTASKANFAQQFNAGKSLVVLHGLAQNDTNFFVHRTDSWERLYPADIDSLTNAGKPSVVFAATCFNSKPGGNHMAKHYMKHPTGGAVAYIGSSYYDFVYRSHPMAREFFEQLVGNGPKQIGKLLNLAKQSILSRTDYEGGTRHVVLSYQLLGDPQMPIWTGTPQSMNVVAPDWLVWGPGVGSQSFDVTVTSSSTPVSGATVCLSYLGQGSSDIYEVTTTNSSGIAHFANVGVPNDSGSASLYISKPGYFPVDTTMGFAHCAIPGDANDDCAFDIQDPNFVIANIFSGGPFPNPLNRGDANADEHLDISDAVYMVSAIFSGGEMPRPGEITDPHGGKRAVVSSDPNDHETAPNDLSISDQVALRVVGETDNPEANSRVIRLDSDVDIYGLSVTLRAAPQTILRVESLLGGRDELQIFHSQTGTLVKIGLIDTLGQKCIRSGERAILRIVGDFEVLYSIAATITPDRQTVRLRPSNTNLVANTGEFSVEDNYPNPFNPETIISFSLPKKTQVSLVIYNVLGQKVRTLVDGVLTPGRHSVTWNGTDDRGNSLASGVYLYTLKAGDFTAKRKMIMMK